MTEQEQARDELVKSALALHDKESQRQGGACSCTSDYATNLERRALCECARRYREAMKPKPLVIKCWVCGIDFAVAKRDDAPGDRHPGWELSGCIRALAEKVAALNAAQEPKP